MLPATCAGASPAVVVVAHRHPRVLVEAVEGIHPLLRPRRLRWVRVRAPPRTCSAGGSTRRLAVVARRWLPDRQWRLRRPDRLRSPVVWAQRTRPYPCRPGLRPLRRCPLHPRRKWQAFRPVCLSRGCLSRACRSKACLSKACRQGWLACRGWVWALRRPRRPLQAVASRRGASVRRPRLRPALVAPPAATGRLRACRSRRWARLLTFPTAACRLRLPSSVSVAFLRPHRSSPRLLR